jgi:hypothetical protein
LKDELHRFDQLARFFPEIICVPSAPRLPSG